MKKIVVDLEKLFLNIIVDDFLYIKPITYLQLVDILEESLYIEEDPKERRRLYMNEYMKNRYHKNKNK